MRWKSASGFFDGGVEFGKSGVYFREVFARAGCERFHFSNIAAGNPFRPWIEYLADWRLIERSPADLEHLISDADIPVASRRIFRDSTSLALMIDLTCRPA